MDQSVEAPPGRLQFIRQCLVRRGILEREIERDDAWSQPTPRRSHRKALLMRFIAALNQHLCAMVCACQRPARPMPRWRR